MSKQMLELADWLLYMQRGHEASMCASDPAIRGHIEKLKAWETALRCSAESDLARSVVGLEYYINNPSAWERFDEEMSERLRPIVEMAKHVRTEPQSAPTREEIENIKTAILEDTTALNDTLWMPDHIFKGGSVVDYIDAILSRSQAVIEHGPVAAIVLRAMQSKADPEIYGASHALKINTDRASKAADEIIALTRPQCGDGK